jgi:hypothetical protein
MDWSAFLEGAQLGKQARFGAASSDARTDWGAAR